MALCFPHAQEIKLNNPPLKEVICQVRFPLILKIQRELPESFQEQVREYFPNVKLESGIFVELPGLEPEPKGARIQPTIYRFNDLSNTTSISIAPDFYALSTTSYTTWHDFQEKLFILKKAFNETYQQEYVNRIGLRFINSFNFKNTHTASLKELLALFQPSLVASIQTDCWQQPALLHQQIHLIANDDEKLTLQIIFRTENEQPEIVLDLDYFSEQTRTRPDIPILLTRFHDALYDAFRWCVTEACLEKFK